MVALPEVQAERCVHSLCETATCGHCVQACPAGAWQLNDDGLFLDTTRCDGCGLCTAACGQEALKIPASALVIERAGLRTALAACEHAVGGGVRECFPAFTRLGCAASRGWPRRVSMPSSSARANARCAAAPEPGGSTKICGL
jgi:Pyruvate/2-oxoacid:ferredoxin oxidoreductase delta subunit